MIDKKNGSSAESVGGMLACSVPVDRLGTATLGAGTLSLSGLRLKRSRFAGQVFSPDDYVWSAAGERPLAPACCRPVSCHSRGSRLPIAIVRVARLHRRCEFDPPASFF